MGTDSFLIRSPLLTALIGIALAPACGLECGDGTHEVDGECVPDDPGSGDGGGSGTDGGSDGGGSGDGGTDGGGGGADGGSDGGGGGSDGGGSDGGGSDGGGSDGGGSDGGGADGGGADGGGADGGGSGDGGTSVEITVCADGSATWTEIQEAIDSSAPGDVIGVCPGIYDPIVVAEGQDVELIAVEGLDVTTIAGGAGTAVTVDGGALRIEGFSVRGTGTVSTGGAFTTVDGVLEVDACRVNESSGYLTLYHMRGESSFIGSTFEDNASSSAGHFLVAGLDGSVLFLHNLVRDSDFYRLMYTNTVDITVRNNIFSHITFQDSYGITAIEDYGGQQEWVNNVFYEIDGNGSITQATFNLSSVDFRNNIVAECDADAWSAGTAAYCLLWNNGGEGFVLEDDCIEADPRFTNAAAGDFTLREGYSPAIDAGDPDDEYVDADGSRNDIGAYGGPYGDW